MPLSPSELRLYSALTEYLETVKMGGVASTQAVWAEKLKAASITLDSLSAELSPQLHPRLSHFLESKSYRKAHDYLSAIASSELANPPAPRQSCQR